MSTENKVSRDLKPSEELLKKIAEVKESLTTAGKMIKEAYDLAIRDGFNPIEARQFLTAQLPFLAERTIRLALPEEAKDQNKVRHTLPQKPEQKQDNVVKITTLAEIKDAELVKADHVGSEQLGKLTEVYDKATEQESEDPKDLEIQFLKEKVIELEDALRKTQLFVPATNLPSQDVHLSLADPQGLIEAAIMTDEAVFKYLRERATQTGDVIVIDRVGSGALAQALHQYKGSFGVAELFLRVIK